MNNAKRLEMFLKFKIGEFCIIIRSKNLNGCMELICDISNEIRDK